MITPKSDEYSGQECSGPDVDITPVSFTPLTNQERLIFSLNVSRTDNSCGTTGAVETGCWTDNTDNIS